MQNGIPALVINSVMDFKQVKHASMEILKTTGKIIGTPLFIPRPKNETLLVELPYENDEQKDMMCQLGREMISKFQPDYYIVAQEAWITKVDAKVGLPSDYTRPSESKDRIEVLIITQYNKDLTIYSEVIPIVKTATGTVSHYLDAEILKMNTENNSSIFNFYIELEGVREKIDKNVKDAKKKKP